MLRFGAAVDGVGVGTEVNERRMSEMSRSDFLENRRELRRKWTLRAEVSGGRWCCPWRGRTVTGEPRAGSDDTDHEFSVCRALC